MTILKDFQLEADKKFDLIQADEKGFLHFKKSTLKSYIHSRESLLLKRVVEEVEKIKERYRCGACDGAKCGHTLGCKALDDIKNILI